MWSYGSPDARALYCSVDPESYPVLDRPKRWDLSYLGTYSADRQPAVERLLIRPALAAPDLRFVVAGPQYPADIDWPANVERIDHVPPLDHPAFYAASRYTLNVTRADMIRAGFSPSVRLFEAASCATPIISDIWDGIETLLEPDREIVLAQEPDAVLRVLTTWSEARGAAMGARARQRVHAEHTSAHRARALAEGLQNALSRRARRHRHHALEIEA
jgi:spore maturation protein CgeB